MSAWSDHRCEAIDDDEFQFLWRRECADADDWIEDAELEEYLEDEDEADKED